MQQQERGRAYAGRQAGRPKRKEEIARRMQNVLVIQRKCTPKIIQQNKDKQQ